MKSSVNRRCHCHSAQLNNNFQYCYADDIEQGRRKGLGFSAGGEAVVIGVVCCDKWMADGVGVIALTSIMTLILVHYNYQSDGNLEHMAFKIVCAPHLHIKL